MLTEFCDRGEQPFAPDGTPNALRRVIYMSEEDRKAGAANFISSGNNVIFSGKVSDELIDEFRSRGFNCIVPPFNIGNHFGEDGLRCFVNEIPVKLLQRNLSSSPEKPSANVASAARSTDNLPPL